MPDLISPSRRGRILLSLLTGVLLSLAWTQWMTGLVLLIAWIPLLVVEDHFYRNRDRERARRFLSHVLLAMVVWNLLSTWWIVNATLVGMIAAVLVSTLFMSITLWLFHWARRSLGPAGGFFMFVFFWMAFEYLYLHGEVSWTWLNLGNGFARDVHLIQWYEFTGVPGGTLWVLVSNVLIFGTLKTGLVPTTRKVRTGYLVAVLVWLVTPVAISMVLFARTTDQGPAVEVVVVQPNIDPYTEKFSGMDPDAQVDTLLALARRAATPQTAWFIGPETAFPNTIWEHQLSQSHHFRQVQQFLEGYPQASFLLGASTARLFNPGESVSPTARKFPSGDAYYDQYNSALLINPDASYAVYHKSQLVIGVEKMPFRQTLGFLEAFALNLGGTMGSLGTQTERSVFTHPRGTGSAAPVICYESIFGDYLGGYIRNGAGMISVITNDGWWGDTPGYRQHFTFASLRAIETRRAVARSANTGISGFINQQGEVLQQTGWGERCSIRARLQMNDAITFYTRHGDFLGRMALLPAILGLLIMLKNHLMKRKPGRIIQPKPPREK